MVQSSGLGCCDPSLLPSFLHLAGCEQVAFFDIGEHDQRVLDHLFDGRRCFGDFIFAFNYGNQNGQILEKCRNVSL